MLERRRLYSPIARFRVGPFQTSRYPRIRRIPHNPALVPSHTLNNLNTQRHHNHPRSIFAFWIECFGWFLILLSPRTRDLWNNCVINGWHIETYTRRRLCWTPSHFRMSTPRDTTIILSQYLPSESNAVICFWFYSHPGHDIYEIVA